MTYPTSTAPRWPQVPAFDDKALPYRFDGALPAAKARLLAEALPTGATPAEVRVAGRLLGRRDVGKMAFFDLHDQSGQLQLMADQDTADFGGLCDRHIGDWVGIVGVPVCTRRGEPSLQVRSWVLLAPTQVAFPDKHHGLTDPETRQRQRHLDTWANPEVRDRIRARARLYRALRSALDERGFDEVETPMLHPIPGGAQARPFRTHHHALDAELYLRIAPELYLKRLVVGGLERVYELGRVFRNEGISPRHNPEFTILEVYQAYGDLSDMELLTEDLVTQAALAVGGSTEVVLGGGERIDLAPPWPRRPMDALVMEVTGEDFSLDRPLQELRRLAASVLGTPVSDAWGPGRILLEVFEARVEASLVGPIFVIDHPGETSPLARPHRSRPGYAERFEAYVGGIELANAFSELTDPELQLARFLDQAAQREAGDDEAMYLDADYVQALRFGLPPTGGLGIGIDRLLALLTGMSNLREVIAFPALRPQPTSSLASISASVLA